MTQRATEQPVDLRSDTVTKPTAAMRAAMAAAEVGDDGYREDPTLNRLEELAASMFGTEAALFTASGTMANQIALRVLAVAGSEVLCPRRCHVARYEHAAAARNAGVQLRGLTDDDGYVSPGDVEQALADQGHHLPPVSAMLLENTHMPASGRPLSVEATVSMAAPARAAGVRVHLDGARLWNAALALGTTPAALARPADTVMACLSKGLGAPMGSVLGGPADVIDAARRERALLGGNLRQGGVVAAAGIVALETMIERLADDHRRARRLAEALADLFPGSIDPDGVLTNIVCAPLSAFPRDLVARLDAQGVRCGTIDARTVRFVTHLDVDDTGTEHAICALSAIAHERS
ncbi:MAG TPA: GntG family PLP-dependent aldolase [Acidimicrobiia bacterium]